MERYFDMVWGWGDILSKTDNVLVVRFDADPWHPKQITC